MCNRNLPTCLSVIKNWHHLLFVTTKVPQLSEFVGNLCLDWTVWFVFRLNFHTLSCLAIYLKPQLFKNCAYSLLSFCQRSTPCGIDPQKKNYFSWIMPLKFPHSVWQLLPPCNQTSTSFNFFVPQNYSSLQITLFIQFVQFMQIFSKRGWIQIKYLEWYLNWGQVNGHIVLDSWKYLIFHQICPT